MNTLTTPTKCECTECGYDYDVEEMDIHDATLCSGCAYDEREEGELSHCCNAGLIHERNTDDGGFGDLLCSDCEMEKDEGYRDYKAGSKKPALTILEVV